MELTLSTNKIKANATKYFATAEKYDFMTQDLMDFLGLDIVKAPATTKLDSYNAYEGGLIAHLLNVAKYALKLNEIVPEHLQVEKGSLLKVALLHQIGKVRMFTPNKSQWHREHQGKMYEFNDDLIALTVGERSAKYALDNGIKLSDTEYQAIINYDKTDTDKQAKWHSEPLAIILRQAHDLAIMESKNEPK
jgi:HD superfamily phosphodiesterase